MKPPAVSGTIVGGRENHVNAHRFDRACRSPRPVDLQPQAGPRQLGHDWVILSLLVPHPPWSPTKVWALPVGMRLYRNRQGLRTIHRQ